LVSFYPAASGYQESSFRIGDQSKKSYGPIPEGTYFFSPNDILKADGTRGAGDGKIDQARELVPSHGKCETHVSRLAA